MKSTTRYLIIICLVLLGLSQKVTAQLDSLYTQQWNRDPIKNLNATTSAQRQIITSDQIRVSGYTRLSDLVQLIDGWTFATITGNSWSLQSNGTGSYNFQNWVLMVNGQRIELDRSYTLDLNLLGISVVDIERIEVVNTNGMYLGEFTQNGLINIITKKSNKNGINYRGYGSLNRAVANDNNAGVNTSQTIGFTRNKFHLNLSFGYMLHQNNERPRRYPYPEGINAKQYTYRLETQYTGTKFSHQFFTSYLQKEIASPTTKNYQAGYLGLYQINTKNQIRLSTTFWGEQNINLNAALSTTTLQYRYLQPTPKGNFIWQTGIATDLLSYQYNVFKNLSYADIYIGSRFAITDTTATIIKPYTSINFPITRKINLFADAQAAFAHGKIAPRFSVGMYKRLSLISNYSFVVGYTETLLEEAFMTNIGQRVNAIEGATFLNNPKLATADFYYNLNIGSSVKFSFNSGLKYTFDLPGTEYSMDTTYPIYSRFTVWERSQPITYYLNWINRFNIHYDVIKNLTFDINYLNTVSLNTWNEELQNIPKHKFTFTLQYELPKRFTLWSRNYWQSETKFRTYDNLYGTPNYQTYGTLSPIFTWDLGISKKLFKDFLNMNFSMRNILNGIERYYPSGSQLDIRFSVGLTANIEGLLGSKIVKP